ncbi:ring u-box protein [Stylonychia lemnae]|uniref:Ring u-box protein n=1 Tax=Stylonychia lemnae TaxID=5949 RepID=A0A078ADU1_STYLE|nr:ring u-box protein [Stylonychia lemnae]|eukprot:CDW79707.1 ring u-box protein [Stylonychia lemnae]
MSLQQNKSKNQALITTHSISRNPRPLQPVNHLADLNQGQCINQQQNSIERKQKNKGSARENSNKQSTNIEKIRPQRQQDQGTDQQKQQRISINNQQANKNMDYLSDSIGSQINNMVLSQEQSSSDISSWVSQSELQRCLGESDDNNLQSSQNNTTENLPRRSKKRRFDSLDNSNPKNENTDEKPRRQRRKLNEEETKEEIDGPIIIDLKKSAQEVAAINIEQESLSEDQQLLNNHHSLNNAIGDQQQPRDSLKKRRLQRMQDKIENNRQSIANLNPSKQDKICTICQCEMEDNDQASLESCIHLFCFVCIKEWATKAENTCPLCKSKFNKIIYRNSEGETQQMNIENKRQRIDDEELMIDTDSDDVCYVCQRGDNIESMIICDLCDYRVAHTQCLGFGDVVPEDDWICDYCTGERESSEDEDWDQSSSEDSHSMIIPDWRNGLSQLRQAMSRMHQLERFGQRSDLESYSQVSLMGLRIPGSSFQFTTSIRNQPRTQPASNNQSNLRNLRGNNRQNHEQRNQNANNNRSNQPAGISRQSRRGYQSTIQEITSNNRNNQRRVINNSVIEEDEDQEEQIINQYNNEMRRTRRQPVLDEDQNQTKTNGTINQGNQQQEEFIIPQPVYTTIPSDSPRGIEHHTVIKKGHVQNENQLMSFAKEFTDKISQTLGVEELSGRKAWNVEIQIKIKEDRLQPNMQVQRPRVHLESLEEEKQEQPRHRAGQRRRIDSTVSNHSQDVSNRLNINRQISLALILQRNGRNVNTAPTAVANNQARSQTTNTRRLNRRSTTQKSESSEEDYDSYLGLNKQQKSKFEIKDFVDSDSDSQDSSLDSRQKRNQNNFLRQQNSNNRGGRGGRVNNDRQMLGADSSLISNIGTTTTRTARGGARGRGRRN